MCDSVEKHEFAARQQELDELVQRARQGTMYEIALRAVALLEDAEAYATEIGIHEWQVPKHINDRWLRDMPLGVMEMSVLLEHCPFAEQWDRPLRQLYDEVVNATRIQLPKRPVVVERPVEAQQPRHDEVAAPSIPVPKVQRRHEPQVTTSNRCGWAHVRETAEILLMQLSDFHHPVPAGLRDNLVALNKRIVELSFGVSMKSKVS